MSTIKLLSSDGEIISIDVAVAKYSNTIKTMLQKDEIDITNEDQVFQVPHVRAEILKKFIQWASHHNDCENPRAFIDLYTSPLIEGSIETLIEHLDVWDANFINGLDRETLFELTSAAETLDIKGLLDICCMTIASKILDRTPEEIRLEFNIRNDFTASDEEQIRKENEFYEEK